MKFYLMKLTNMPFFRFGIIGVLNTIIHGSILSLLVGFLSFNVISSNLMAFIVANVFSFLLNSFFTFKTKATLLLYYRFLLSSLLSLALTLFISYISFSLGFSYLIGFGFIVILVPVFSFFIMKAWAFK